QLRVERRVEAWRQLDAFTPERREAGEGERDGVGTGNELDDAVLAALVGDRGTDFLDQDGTGRLHGDTWQHGSGGVGHDAGNAGGAGTWRERPRLGWHGERSDHEGTGRDTRHEPLLSRRVGPNVLTEMTRWSPYARRRAPSTHEIEMSAPRTGASYIRIFLRHIECALVRRVHEPSLDLRARVSVENSLNRA